MQPDPILSLPPSLAPPAHGSPPVRWRWWLHLLIIGPYPLALGLLGAARHSTHRAALGSSWQGLLMVCVIEAALFGLILGVALYFSRATRDDLRLRKGNFLVLVPLGIGYSVAIRLALGAMTLMLAAVLIASHLIKVEELTSFISSHHPDVEAVVDVQALRNDPVYFWLSLTVVSFVVAGLREELWRTATAAGLRHLWPGAFASGAGEYLGMAVIAVIFGLGHLPQGLLAVALTSLIGMALGTVMVFHRSTWPAVVAHGMFDAASFALIPLVSGHVA